MLMLNTKKSLFSNRISYSEFIVISVYEKTSHIKTVHCTYIYLYEILYYIKKNYTQNYCVEQRETYSNPLPLESSLKNPVRL